MTRVMVTIQASAATPTVADLCAEFDLAEDAFDLTFGVVEIDPDEHLYTVLVDEDAAAKMQPTRDWGVTGPYSNPRIAPFGPPEAEQPGGDARRADPAWQDDIAEEAAGSDASARSEASDDCEE